MKTKIYSHRGARGLAPENTLIAFETALQNHVDAIDMDVGLTQDGIVVVTHDMALNTNITRYNNQWIQPHQRKLIKDLTYQQLKKYDVGRIDPNTYYGHAFPNQKPQDGAYIPTLKEAIEHIQAKTPDIRYQIEIKTRPTHPHWTATPKIFAAAITAVLDETGIGEQTEIQAFDWRVLRAIQEIAPHISTAYLTDQSKSKNMTSPIRSIASLWSAGFLLSDYNNSIPEFIEKLGGKIWGPDYRELTPALVAEAHQHGLRVITWTVNHPADMQLMIDYQVDGIITDRPDLLYPLI